VDLRIRGNMSIKAPSEYKKLAAQELKRRNSTFSPWYSDIPEVPEDVLDVAELP